MAHLSRSREMAKLRFDPVTYQFYYQCPSQEGAPAKAAGFSWDPIRRGSQHSREFQGLRRQLRKALISGCSQRRALEQASGTQSRSIGVDVSTKGGRHIVTHLPLMAWMPHGVID
jgi:hypothetical protein